MKKIILCLLLICTLAFTFAIIGCGEKVEENPKEDPPIETPIEQPTKKPDGADDNWTPPVKQD